LSAGTYEAISVDPSPGSRTATTTSAHNSRPPGGKLTWRIG